jgi:hypothetical protein
MYIIKKMIESALEKGFKMICQQNPQQDLISKSPSLLLSQTEIWYSNTVTGH